MVNEHTMQNIDAEIQKIYERMVPDIQKEIESFYQRYADKEGISLAEAKKRVSKFAQNRQNSI